MRRVWGVEAASAVAPAGVAASAPGVAPKGNAALRRLGGGTSKRGAKLWTSAAHHNRTRNRTRSIATTLCRHKCDRISSRCLHCSAARAAPAQARMTTTVPKRFSCAVDVQKTPVTPSPPLLLSSEPAYFALRLADCNTLDSTTCHVFYKAVGDYTFEPLRRSALLSYVPREPPALFERGQSAEQKSSSTTETAAGRARR